MEPSRFGEEKPLPRKKSGSSGCMIILLIFLGLGVLAVGAIGVGFYQVMQDPQVKEAMTAMGSMVAAEGRAELQAAGCDAAMVIDMRALASLAKNDPNNRPEDVAALENAVFINCVLVQPKPGITCEKLARVYRDAIKDSPNPPPKEVSVFVQAQGQREPVCNGRYDEAGLYLGEGMAPPSGHYPPGQRQDLPAEDPRFGVAPGPSPSPARPDSP